MSSKSERFFTWVWRVNGLILLIAGLISLSLIGIAAIGSGIFANRDRPETQLTDVAGADLVAEELKLGSFRELQGTDFLIAQLAAPSKYIGSGSSGGLGATRNLLFFNTKSKQAHWLFDSNDIDIVARRSILNTPDLEMDDDEDSKRFVIGMVIEIADHVEDELDVQPKRLVFASADGKTVTPIADSIGGMLGQHHIDESTILIFYVRAGSVGVLDFNPTSVIVRSDSTLSVE